MRLNSTFLTFCAMITQFKHSVKCGITGPLNPLQYKDGDNALFKWSTDDGKPIYSANFGKRLTKGGTSVLQFMNINKYTKKKNFNSLYPEYKNRLDFIGNLTTGRAWFILKALTLNDTGEYVADIRDESGVLAFSVDLIVEKGAEKKANDQLTKLHFKISYCLTSELFWFFNIENGTEMGKDVNATETRNAEENPKVLGAEKTNSANITKFGDKIKASTIMIVFTTLYVLLTVSIVCHH